MKQIKMKQALSALWIFSVSLLMEVNIYSTTQAEWYQPDVNTTWQWQLQGEINTGYDVDVYDIDLFDVPVSLIQSLQQQGRIVICYFSAGSYEPFRVDADDFPESTFGLPLDGFEEELWIDIRSPEIQSIMMNRLDLAMEKGCDGVEPDNVDGYINPTGFELSGEDQLAFNFFLARESHQRGLSVGLKNDLDQVPELVAEFDFSVNEQCHEFDECHLLDPFIEAGKPVFNVEYESSFVEDEVVRNKMCEQALERNLRTLVLPLDLDDSFRFSCDEGF